MRVLAVQVVGNNDDPQVVCRDGRAVGLGAVCGLGWAEGDDDPAVWFGEFLVPDLCCQCLFAVGTRVDRRDHSVGGAETHLLQVVHAGTGADGDAARRVAVVAWVAREEGD